VPCLCIKRKGKQNRVFGTAQSQLKLTETKERKQKKNQVQSSKSAARKKQVPGKTLAGFAARFFLALNLVASGCFGAKHRLGKRVLCCLKVNQINYCSIFFECMSTFIVILFVKLFFIVLNFCLKVKVRDELKPRVCFSESRATNERKGHFC
jgi:hypothetical protein